MCIFQAQNVQYKNHVEEGNKCIMIKDLNYQPTCAYITCILIYVLLAARLHMYVTNQP